MEWQPIETAPKDGTYMLLLIKGYIPATGRWSELHEQWTIHEEEDYCCEKCWNDNVSNPYSPDFWMPLPDTQ